jgi:hypothetical protein
LHQRRRRRRGSAGDPVADGHKPFNKGRMIPGASRIAASSFVASGIPA